MSYIIDILIIISITLSVIMIKIGNQEDKKLMKYIGVIIILLSLIYILVSVGNGFIKGLMGPLILK